MGLKTPVRVALGEKSSGSVRGWEIEMNWNAASSMDLMKSPIQTCVAGGRGRVGILEELYRFFKK